MPTEFSLKGTTSAILWTKPALTSPLGDLSPLDDGYRIKARAPVGAVVSAKHAYEAPEAAPQYSPRIEVRKSFSP